MKTNFVFPPSILRSVSVVLLTVLAGCGAMADSSTAESTALAAEESKACQTLGHKLDAAVASTTGNNAYDAALSVTTQDCGTSFHSAGPSHLDAHRLFRIGSTTKTYVATSTLQLVGDGRVDLDHRLDEYLPDAPTAVAAVTVRQLLQHTSGIFSFTSAGEFWAAFVRDPMRHWTPRELVDLALTHDPYFAPGTGWEYSNTNYILLGMMLEALEGKPIARIIRDRILTPNDLRETFFEEGEPVVGELAPAFFWPPEGNEPWPPGTDVSHGYSVSIAWTAGAMVATPADGSRFIELLAGGKLLPPTLQTEMLKGVATHWPELRYGLGVMLFDASFSAGQGPGIGHGGDIIGHHSLTLHFPDAHISVSGMVDSDRGNGWALVKAASRALVSQDRAYPPNTSLAPPRAF